MSSLALPSGSKKVTPVLGFLSVSIVVTAFSPHFLAHFASLHMPCGDCNASSTHCRCASRSAFLIMRLFRFLAALYASQLSSVCSRLFWRFKRRVSAWMSLHYWVYPAFDLRERRLNDMDPSIASLIAKTMFLTY